MAGSAYRTPGTRAQQSRRCLYCGYPCEAHDEASPRPCLRCGVPTRAPQAVAPHLRCARCPGVVLTTGSIGPPDARVHECVSCRGVFLDAASYCAVLDAAVFGESLELGRFVPLPPGKEKDLLALVRCPSCGAEMDRVRFGAWTSVIIDVCASHGAWLDATKIVSLVEASRQLDAGAPPADEDPAADPIEEALLNELAAAEAEYDRDVDWQRHASERSSYGPTDGWSHPSTYDGVSVAALRLGRINDLRLKLDQHRLTKSLSRPKPPHER